MFRQPANKLSISGRVKRAAQASGEVRSRVSSFVPLAHVLFRQSDFRMTLTSVSVRYLSYQPMDEKIKTWLLRFPAKENPNMEKALFDWPIVLQYDVKAKYRLISRKFSGMKVFHPSVRLFNQPKATRVCIRSINQSNRSISVPLLFLFCSRVFISRSFENRSIPQMESLLAG